MTFSIRPAERRDLDRIQKIYNDEIIHHFANWNAEPFDDQHFQTWFDDFQKNNFPLFVVEHIESKDIAGYADYSFFRTNTGYRHTVEHSVFIDPAYARQGLGLQLLQHLIDHAKTQDVHVMVAAIDHENVASIQLHEKLGFKHTGYMPRVGRKMGTWRDLVLMQLMFDFVPNDHE